MVVFVVLCNTILLFSSVDEILYGSDHSQETFLALHSHCTIDESVFLFFVSLITETIEAIQ